MYLPLPPPFEKYPCRIVQDLPLYRYVPGLYPHPIKHPQGHSFQRVLKGEWSEGLEWQKDSIWLEGLDLFDNRFYWEAHEVWEFRWKQVADPYRSVLQAMILSAASLLQKHMGRDRIADKSWIKARSLLLCAGQSVTNVGVDLEKFIFDMDGALKDGGWPVVQSCRSMD